MPVQQTRGQRVLYIALLILSGEAIFLLPFILARIFRPTFLEVFDIDNLDLGLCFSAYGIVAMLSYAFGGLLADRYKPHKLMAVALWLTGAGGLVMASYPSLPVLQFIYAYWGFTTIFLFWAAMIKATRIWGGNTRQVRAFGLLDGGRGLVAAGFGSLGVLIFWLFLPDAQQDLTDSIRREAFRYVILCTSAVVFLAGIAVFFLLRSGVDAPVQKGESPLLHFRKALKLRSVWLLMLIILCAYFGYKTTDIISLYAAEVMGYSEVDAARTGSFLLYLRPTVGILAGLLVPRRKATVYLIAGFGLTLLGALFYSTGFMGPGVDLVFMLSIVVLATGVYAGRVLYFAVMQAGRIPLELTGTAVGLVSLVGYTPDIFAGPLIGYLLDSSPGETGHQHVFGLLCVFSLAGICASLLYHRHTLKVRYTS